MYFDLACGRLCSALLLRELAAGVENLDSPRLLARLVFLPHPDAHRRRRAHALLRLRAQRDARLLLQRLPRPLVQAGRPERLHLLPHVVQRRAGQARDLARGLVARDVLKVCLDCFAQQEPGLKEKFASALDISINRLKPGEPEPTQEERERAVRFMFDILVEDMRDDTTAEEKGIGEEEIALQLKLEHEIDPRTVSKL